MCVWEYTHLIGLFSFLSAFSVVVSIHTSRRNQRANNIVGRRIYLLCVKSFVDNETCEKVELQGKINGYIFIFCSHNHIGFPPSNTHSVRTPLQSDLFCS